MREIGNASRRCGESTDKIVGRTVIAICFSANYVFLPEAGRAGAVYNLYFKPQILLTVVVLMFAHRRQLDIHGRQSFGQQKYLEVAAAAAPIA